LNLRWLLRMSQWARKPPSGAGVKLVLFIVAALLVVLALESLGLWPEGLTAQKMRP
jgi:hypothetical protein